MSKVVAKVDGKEITQDDVVKFVETIGPQVAMQFSGNEGIKTIISEMINQELLLIDAKENNLHEDEDFLVILNETADNLLKNYAFQKVIEDAEVTDKEIEDFFNTNKDQFAGESVDASHILVETEAEARDVLNKLEAGEAFEELAKAYSTCPSAQEGGNLGEFGRGMMVPEFENAAFNMEVGEISEPIKTDFGYHVIKLNGKKSADETKIADVYQDVKMEILRQKQQAMYVEKIDELNKKHNVELFEENIR